MAVSKRTRFEVLRRDDYTCRYCRSKDNTLTIDHVIPQALGGTDSPENLVACCRDCNAGKSSISPDAAMVAEVESDAIRWASARKLAANRIEVDAERHKAQCGLFYKQWTDWDKSGDLLPSDFDESIERWLANGLSLTQITDALWVSVGKTHVRAADVFRYMSGILRNKLTELDVATRAELEREG